MTEAPHPKLDELIAVMERLRAPGGCAWDRAQTHETLVQYLVEETYELIDAIESGDRDELVEELGDVLYQVLFHSDIAAEEGRFTLEDVAAHMTAKMVGRHPHVFGDATADTPDEVMVRWEQLKQAEKPARTSVLDGIPRGMPALALASKVIGRAGKVGVTVEAQPDPSHAGTEEQLGRQLLALVARSSAAGLDAERALRSAIRALGDEIREAETAAPSPS
ncbi:YabN family protein [Lysobacter korlensis]|uniref:YabN family protein n=1 Tax=Lysobacter korlensis TaxID=553636 RepID=A0ABV6RZX2_9GAMM